MKPKFRNLIATFAPLSRSSIIVCTSICAVASADAAPQTWSGATNATWVTSTNWVANAVPGSTTTTSNDKATFNSALAGGTVGGSADPVVIDLNRRIGLVLFDTANVGPYVIGATGLNPLLLSAINTATNSVTMNDTVVSSQTLAGPLKMTQPSGQSDNYAFVNNSSTIGANLIISGNIDATNTTRTWQFILDGTNTGNNIISGNINNTTTTGNGGAGPIQKNGAGTWILSGTNTFIGSTSGGNNLHEIVTHGVQVNAGTLVLENNLAFGNTNGAKVFVNGGVLELNSSSANGSITLDNALNITLASGATIRSNGTNAFNSRISLATGAAVSSTISTVGSSDVLTVGNAANDLSGGASDSVLHIAGPGTVLLGQASNYAGKVAIDTGTLQLGNPTALGPATSAGVAFGAGATGILQLNGNNITLVSLSTDPSVGTPIIGNNNLNPATLTLNVASGSSTYGGILRDGAAGGALALVKAGGSTRILTGASTYTGGTTISNGTLLANNTSGSATGTGSVSVNGTGTLGGTGTVSGAVTVASAAAIAPGDGGIGTLSTGSLTLDAGSQLNYDITNPSTLDQITVTGGGTLTINGGQLNINGGAGLFTTNGVYNLIGGYAGAIGGSGTSALTLNASNKDLVNKAYTFGESGGYVTLTIANSGAVVDYWNIDANGNWNTGPWTPGVPDSVGAFASFGGGGTAITAPRTVTVLTSKTVGTLSFNNATQAFTLAAGGGTINLDNGASGSFVTDTAGSHLIQAPIALTTNGVSFSVVNLADTLTTTGVISGSGPLSKIGNGALVLNGANTYMGATNITGGTVAINSATSLGDSAYLTTIGAGTLQATADITSVRNFNITDVASTISVDATKTYEISGMIGAGSGTLNKAGDGTLVLTGANSYTGGTVINSGIVQINSAVSLGDLGGVATLNSGGTLKSTASIGSNRAFTVNGGIFSPDVATTMTLNGIVSGSGGLRSNGAGKLSLANSGNNYTGGTHITGATLGLDTGVNFGTGGIPLSSGTIVLNNATITTNIAAASTLIFDATTPITVAGTNTINTPTRMRLNSSVSGSGTVNMVIATGGTNRADLQNNWSGFSGNLNITGSGQARVGLLALSSGQPTFNGAGWANTTLSLDGATIAPTTFSGGNTMIIGALTSTGATGTLGGGTAGAVTYSIGGLDTSTSFAGLIAGNANLTKTGIGTLTLLGDNTYTGATTVNSGATLQIGAGGATGSISTTSGVNDNGVLVYNRNDSLTVPYTIYGDGSVSVIGSGTVNFTSGGNGFTGGTLIDNASTVNINSTWGLGGAGYGGITFGVGGGTLQYATSLLNSATDLTQDTSDGGLGIAGNPRDVTLSGNATIDTNGHDVLFLNPVGNYGAGGLTKIGAGTLALAGSNTYTGATAVNAGTLALVGGSQQSAITVNNTGTSLGFTLGSTTSSISTVTFGAGTTVKINGTPTLASYTLMTASSISGITPVLDTPIAGYSLSVTGGNTLVLIQSAGYSSWASLNGASANLSDDHDGDGVSNGIEFFIGGPNGNTTGFTTLPGVTNTAGVLSVTWTYGVGYTGNYGTDFEVVTSTTLSGWTLAPLGAGAGQVVIDAPNRTVKYTFPTGPVKTFARLKVTN